MWLQAGGRQDASGTELCFVEAKDGGAVRGWLSEGVVEHMQVEHLQLLLLNRSLQCACDASLKCSLPTQTLLAFTRECGFERRPRLAACFIPRLAQQPLSPFALTPRQIAQSIPCLHTGCRSMCANVGVCARVLSCGACSNAIDEPAGHLLRPRIRFCEDE